MKRFLILITVVLFGNIAAWAQFSINVGYIHETMHLSEPVWMYGEKNVGMWSMYAEAEYNLRLPSQWGVALGARIYVPTTVPISNWGKEGYADYDEKDMVFPLRVSYTFRELLWGWDVSVVAGGLVRYTYGYANYSEDATPLTIHFLDEDNAYAIKGLTLMPLVGVRVGKRHWQGRVEYMPWSLDRSLHGNYTNHVSGMTVGLGYVF